MDASAAAVAPAATAVGRRLEPVPARARDLQMLGELAGSGYRDAPALVRRSDGQLIKLTPLLYELIDAIDGRRDREELALELSRRVGKQATAEDVDFLLERKLRPLGLIAGRDGQQPEVERSNPLLALRPRAVVSKPEQTSRLTAPFVWLFKPPVMLALLLAFAAICSWLLLDKGLASALHQAFYEPGLILAIWGLLVLSMAFHEIGHAAACRYGGARPGVMGGGLYLIWPAFYTEVSDSYRLGRGARLRVDLGGLYFSAIFAVATAGLWWLTGADALLLVIAVQMIQMVRQLAPFIRADGYHIVSDLVGVPDLFAHIKPTLLGMLPTRWGRPENNTLKPWARGVVTAWVLLTVPALLAVLTVIVLTFPRLAATASDSIGLRWDEASSYWAAGDLMGVATAVGSIALVALPVLSVVYLITYLSRRAATSAWRGTAGRPRMRALALAGVAGLIALVGWAWWPGESYGPVDARESGAVPTTLSVPGEGELVQPAGVPSLVPAAWAGSVPAGATVQPPGPPLPGSEDDGGSDQTAGRAPSATLAPAAPGSRPDVAVGPSSLLVDAVEPEAAAPAPVFAPLPAGSIPSAPAEPSPDSPEWPFPFEAPAPPEPGDNQAMAVNTTDGSTLWDFAVDFQILDGADPIDQVNEAFAFASCQDCTTVAVAFQVILVLGQPDTAIPVNTAEAANYDCISCETFAFADQIVANITELPGPEVIASTLERLRELELDAASLSPLEILGELEGIEEDLLTALEDILAVDLPADAEATTQAEGSEPGAAEDEQQSEAGMPAADQDTLDDGSESAPAIPADPETPVEEEPATDPAADGVETESSAFEPAPEGSMADESEPAPADSPAAEPGTAAEEPAAEGEAGASPSCVEDESTPTAECPEPTASEDAAVSSEPPSP